MPVAAAMDLIVAPGRLMAVSNRVSISAKVIVFGTENWWLDIGSIIVFRRWEVGNLSVVAEDLIRVAGSCHKRDIAFKQVMNAKCLAIVPQIGEGDAVSIIINIATIVGIADDGFYQIGMNLSIHGVFPSVPIGFAVETFKKFDLLCFLIRIATEIIFCRTLGLLVVSVIVGKTNVEHLAAFAVAIFYIIEEVVFHCPCLLCCVARLFVRPL